MKYIYILEDDPRITKDLFETLKSIDPSLGLRFFNDLASFHEWLKIAVTEGPMSLAQGGSLHELDIETAESPPPAEATDELRLVIAKDEFLGTRNMSLVRRARDFFVRKKMCTEAEPTALILTAFDSPDFDIKLAEDRIVNNVIFKPFDKLILKQDIEYALSGRHPLSSETVSAMKVKAVIEMLKEVSLSSISEIGFTSVNNHEIRIGSLTKYYSDSFKAKNKRSAFAFCSACKEVGPEQFLCEFRFFGIDNLQISEIRRHVLAQKKHESVEIKNKDRLPSRFLIIDDDKTIPNDLQMVLGERLENAESFSYTSYGQLLSDISDKDTPSRQVLPEQFEYVIANYSVFEEEQKSRWEGLLKVLKERAEKAGITDFKEPVLYFYSKKEIKMELYRTFAGWVKDIFYLPLDKSYIMKKIISAYPGVINKNPVTIGQFKEHVTLKVANPVEITEISEAGLILKYYRGIGIGSFREFVLWLPDELETPEIIGTCNYTEKDKNTGTFFLNHFVFFGMKDLFLKHVRIWVRDSYIRSKGDE
ncbi:hypothetical protein D3C87_257860 [compost metagenome]